MNGGSLVVAYHGCDATVRDLLVTGALRGLNHSENGYDWLGPGVYFFEADAPRAQSFAESSATQPSKLFTAKPIGTPKVVGAVLRVSNWMDMSTQEGRDYWLSGYKTLAEAVAVSPEQKMPENEPEAEPISGDEHTVLRRKLDYAVFKMVKAAHPEIQAVRAPFYQGAKLAATTSEFRAQTHMQIALWDTECVVGWFLPPGEKCMSDGEFAAAEARFAEAKKARTAAKKRQRAGS